MNRAIDEDLSLRVVGLKEHNFAHTNFDYFNIYEVFVSIYAL